jgi:hypothetical protein
MDLAPYVEELRHQLLVTAEAGGPEAVAVAERLVASLDAATRLVLLDVLTVAAGEITGDLAPGSVEIRLRGRDPELVVTSPPADLPPEPAAEPPAALATDADEGATARLTLRLPEQTKTRLEEAAARSGLSVNAWLVRAAASALAQEHRDHGTGRRDPAGGQRFTGWAR